MVKRIGIALAIAMLFSVCLEIGQQWFPSSVYGLVANVEAIVGRPLTPVSVSGVARRTARRCSADVYDC